MLGIFSLQTEEQEFTDQDNRSRKVWLLLAYILCNRDRTVSQDELIALLWGDAERSANPANALKTMFHRLREMLNHLSPAAGRTTILRVDQGYLWNSAVPVTLDLDAFERLCKEAHEERSLDRRLEQEQAALALYRGDFLPKLRSEPWAVSVRSYYHELWLSTLLDAATLLTKAKRFEETEALCRRGMELDPYSEPLCRRLLSALLSLGRHQECRNAYEVFARRLYDNFAVSPSDETRSICREAMKRGNSRAVSIAALQEQLQENGSARGALLCDYDFFRVLYQAEARAVSRNGDAVHICLLSVTAANGSDLSKRSLDRCMTNLKDLICLGLRKGDIVSRCSISQYILMLPHANYENSCMVCERVIRAFSRQYPHSPALLRYAVQPLEPVV